MFEKHYARPRDRSLEAYKDWINGITQRLNPGAKDSMTEDKWITSWKKFWAKVDRADDAKNEPDI